MRLEKPLSQIESSEALHPTTLKQRAFQGTIWIIGGYGTSQVLRFGSNIVLTRLLFPEAFGLMALVSVVLQGLTMFSDIGVGPAIIRHPRGNDPDFYNTAWTIQVMRGFALWAVACGLAFPIARFYSEPQLAQLIPVAAFAAVISGFNSTKRFSANREMRLGRVTLIDLVSQIVGIVVMIAVAWFWRSVWAIVIGGLASGALKRALSHLLLPGPNNKFCWDRPSAGDLYSFGRWIFVSTVFTFLAMQSDKLLLGRFVSLETLGIYSIAFSLVSIVSGVFDQLSQRILMPSVSHVSRNASHRFEDAFLRSRGVILSAAAIAIANLVLLAPSFFQILYDPRYASAGRMAQFLAVGLWFSLLQKSTWAGLVAIGHSRVLAASNAINFLTTLVAAPIGYSLWGVAGFIAGWSLGNLSAALVVDVALTQRSVRAGRQSLAITLRLMVLVGVGILLQYLMRETFTVMPKWVVEVIPAILISFLALPTVVFAVYFRRNPKSGTSSRVVKHL